MEEIGDLDADKSNLFQEALASEGQQNSTGNKKIVMKKVILCSDKDISCIVDTILTCRTKFFLAQLRYFLLLISNSRYEHGHGVDC